MLCIVSVFLLPCWYLSVFRLVKNSTCSRFFYSGDDAENLATAIASQQLISPPMDKQQVSGWQSGCCGAHPIVFVPLKQQASNWPHILWIYNKLLVWLLWCTSNCLYFSRIKFECHAYIFPVWLHWQYASHVICWKMLTEVESQILVLWNSMYHLKFLENYPYHFLFSWKLTHL